MHDSLFLRFPFLSLLYCISAAGATLMNRTIDDQYGDEGSGVLPTYSPPSVWYQGNNCTSCIIQPDPNQAYMKTWHQATRQSSSDDPPVISLSFSGTAIYAYCILSADLPGVITNTNLTFRLDGDSVQQYFAYSAPASSASDQVSQYNVPVYVNDSISSGPHILEIEASPYTDTSVILFDYAVYRFDSATDQTSSTSFPSQSSSSTSFPSPSSPSAVPASSTPYSILSFSTVSSASTAMLPSSSQASQTPSSKESKIKSSLAGGIVGGIAFLGLLAALLYCKARQPRTIVQRQRRVDVSSHENTPASPARPQRAGTPVANPAPTTVGLPSRSKAVMLEGALASETRQEDEEEVHNERSSDPAADLQAASARSSRPWSSSISASSRYSTGEEERQNQIAALREELAELQRHVLWDMDGESPPEYEEHWLSE
ncbi:hypothetical protein OE88DRAFT_741004 [Heliocybe sulcata]|uniref:Uncharacterized protein n=1 Tax=Heliocybe sulcata TaxID=5364 RepID=A0A5C3MVK4_9AGAM|nr:hypothetical protein OE88DRAFT_741004 [Heliocybe sulcata]